MLTSMIIQKGKETFIEDEFIKIIKHKFSNAYTKFSGDVGTELDIIEPSTSTKIHPTLLLQKPGTSEYRFLFDGRLYNQLMIKINCYPNDANKIFLELKNFNHISKIDLSNAFHQLSVNKDNREYFAFHSQLGIMQYKRLIIGGKNSTILFQLAMERTFKSIEQYIKIFVDDIIILTPGSFEFHRDILFKFFSICNDLELKVSLPKCQFNAKYIKFLSYKVEPKGITPCDESVDKLIRRHVPSSKKELYNFLQSASYFKRCLPEFASKTANLFTLATDKNGKIEFSKEHLAAFEQVKENLINAPKLAFYNPNFKTFLTTDASNHSVETYLNQVNPDTNEERPIAFWSAKLPPTVKDRCPTYTELYAIEHALRYFGYLVANIKLTIRRDHKCLSKIMTTNNRKYIELLHVADLLSRLNEPKECNAIIRTSSNPQHQVITSLSMTENIAKLINSMNLVEEQQVDKDIIEALEIGHVKNHPISKNGQGIIKINFGGCEKVYLPVKLIPPILDLAHDYNNHYGYKKMLKMLGNCYSSVLKKMIKEKLYSCYVCLKHNVVPTNHPIPSSIPPYQIIENLVMDFSDFHSEEGKNKEKYLLVILDSASKYLWTIPMHTTTGEEIIKVLTELFLEYDFCKTIKSDNAKYFNNEKVLTYLKSLNIEMIFTTPSHSRGNTLAKATIRYVHLAVEKAKSQFKSSIVSWTEIIPWTTFIHNTNICESTNTTPFSLMLLRESPNPVDTFMKSNSISLFESNRTHAEQLEIANQFYQSYREEENLRLASKDNFKLKKNQLFYLKNIKRKKKFDTAYVGPYVAESFDSETNKVKYYKPTGKKLWECHISNVKIPKESCKLPKNPEIMLDEV
uniref:Integrase catalytic domain-containing protein n=1 Tax=Strongyloides venezuelensis TaxID=75913 RepID=A0A0K0FFP3_STRVS